MLNNGLTQENEVYINATFISSLTMLDFFIATFNNGGSLSSWFSLVSGKEMKTQKTLNHLCNIRATRNFVTCWAISLCLEVWCLITILTDLVCGVNGCKIIKFLIRSSHRICLNDFQLQWITQIDHTLHGLFFWLPRTIRASGL